MSSLRASRPTFVASSETSNEKEKEKRRRIVRVKDVLLRKKMDGENGSHPSRSSKCRVDDAQGNRLAQVFIDSVSRPNRGRADVGRGDENDERSKRGGRCRVRVCETEIVQTRDANAVGEAVSSSDGTRNY